jgi:hypothetical protein
LRGFPDVPFCLNTYWKQVLEDISRGWRGWTAAIGVALIVNIVAIMIGGLIALSASKTEWFNRFFENAVKPSATQADSVNGTI